MPIPSRRTGLERPLSSRPRTNTVFLASRPRLNDKQIENSSYSKNRHSMVSLVVLYDLSFSNCGATKTKYLSDLEPTPLSIEHHTTTHTHNNNLKYTKNRCYYTFIVSSELHLCQRCYLLCKLHVPLSPCGGCSCGG